MLGWEYPPHIAGGLGTACEGLTKGLSRLGVDLTFVIPRVVGDENAEHMNLVDQYTVISEPGAGPAVSMPHLFGGTIERIGVLAALKPYWREVDYLQYIDRLDDIDSEEADTLFTASTASAEVRRVPRARYGHNIFEEVARFTQNVIRAVQSQTFDVIHAHDWMTFPAGVALSQMTGKPLIVHIHSLESDRSGAWVNEQIDSVERMGTSSATGVIAVSHYTKSIINQRHGVDLNRIFVVHNGIYPKSTHSYYKTKGDSQHKVVLFLGRITFQKGPDYFVRAAEKVISIVPNVQFLMAGAGDMLGTVQNLAKDLGISNYFRFTGFLNEKEVEEAFNIADLYVMPSVSEPFGISALEAIDFSTPVIISKQSGVSEVLGHSLKFDFWDVERLADLIVNGLLYEEMRADMVSMAREELRRLRWDAAAAKTLEVYKALVH